MINRLICVMVFIPLVIAVVNCQNKSSAAQDGMASFRDDALGISFAKIGTVEKIEGSTYRIMLQPSNNSQAHTAFAQVSTADRLFVDLPGSYGGRFFFDEPSAEKFFQNRILVDSVNTGQLTFRREYWVVYAGMGMWEGVINCYTQKGSGYYVVSLVQELPAGKPGEESDGKPLTADELKEKIFKVLQDTTNVNVSRFTTLLTSVQIYK